MGKTGSHLQPVVLREVPVPPAPPPVPSSNVDRLSAAVEHPSLEVVRQAGPLVLLPMAALLFVPTEWPRWALMWTLAVSVYAGCKWATWWPQRHRAAAPWRHAAYLLAWVGMDARAFLAHGVPEALRPRPFDWWFAAAKTAFGAALLAWAVGMGSNVPPLARGWLGLVGIAMTLHFGLIDLLSLFWRRAGVFARPLMNWPPLARSLAGFWGRRWNTAFRDVVHQLVFRPLVGRTGGRAAMAAVFVVSGLVHDLVISISAGAAYGAPTLYFLIQAAAALLERAHWGVRLGLGHGWRGWAFTACAVVAPLPLLFPEPFVLRVVVPMLDAMRIA
ncbi:MAG: hypothetical protein DWQ37_21740 [Planctomycetota bacterium]|nr:MAG: hypothetical protein DWQ37_21740 [Planctomycetota bacterium]